MNFVEVLGYLQGLVGTRVSVTVAGVDGPPMAANLMGTLRAGSELALDTDPEGGEAFYFYFAENPGMGFFLHAAHFRHAELTGLDADDRLLAVVCGSISLTISAEDAPRASDG